MATILTEPAKHKPVVPNTGTPLEIEHEVLLAQVTEPAMRLIGKVSAIRRGRKDLALSDDEWQNLGLPDDAEQAVTQK